MNRGNLFIGLFVLLVVGVVLVGEAQQDNVEEVNEVKYDNGEYMFTYFDKGIYIMDNFNPIRRASYYKCEMGKTYPYSLS